MHRKRIDDIAKTFSYFHLQCTSKPKTCLVFTRTSDQIGHRLMLFAGPLLTFDSLLLAHFKPYYLVNSKKKQAYSLFKSTLHVSKDIPIYSCRANFHHILCIIRLQNAKHITNLNEEKLVPLVHLKTGSFQINSVYASSSVDVIFL